MLNSAAAHGYGAVSGSYDNANAATDRVLLLDETTGNISSATARIVGLFDFARITADSVFGPRIKAESNAQPASPKSPARAEGLRSAVGDLHAVINALESELERFRAI